MLSLRAHVLSGASLWTLGLVLFSFTFIAWIFRHHPDMPFLGVRGGIHFIWASHGALIFLIAAIAMAIGVLQVRRGLAGIKVLRVRLAAVREGCDGRVEGQYVPEVQPLVDDLNALLDHREQAVRRAVDKAGDLAHRLKTPLSVLAHEAERADAAGHKELAAAISLQVELMRRQTNYHLAHARAAASGATPGTTCLVSDSAEGLARTLARLHAARALSFDVRVPPAHVVRVQREDLDEMLGNLLDNACKWTRSRVLIESRDRNHAIEIAIDDDGPGIPAAMRSAVLQRGVRADEQSAGSGLGLAIVRDLAELYRGSVEILDSALGGVQVVLTLPKGGAGGRPARPPAR